MERERVARPDPTTERGLFVACALREKAWKLGINGAWVLVREFFTWCDVKNGREVGGLAGVMPTPYHSGESDREQGLTMSVNQHVRWMTTALAWSWLRYQPESALRCWF